MPSDYAGIATFVPAPADPTPPWQGQTGADNIPAYGTPAYAQAAYNICQEAYAQAQQGDQHSVDLLTYAKNAADQGAGVASSPITGGANSVPVVAKSTTPITSTALAGIGVLGLLLVGGLVLMGRKKG